MDNNLYKIGHYLLFLWVCDVQKHRRKHNNQTIVSATLFRKGSKDVKGVAFRARTQPTPHTHMVSTSGLLDIIH